jgi:hypothetical protein
MSDQLANVPRYEEEVHKDKKTGIGLSILGIVCYCGKAARDGGRGQKVKRYGRGRGGVWSPKVRFEVVFLYVTASGSQ